MSNYIEDHIIEQVREQADIVQTIADYVPLKKTGSNLKGLCPFHSEKTPSFIVSPEKQIYHCFGCGEGGNSFKFIMKLESLSFPEAVKHLAERFGINVSFSNQSPAEKEIAEAREQLYYINLAAGKYFHRLLTEFPKGEPAREYIIKRGISDKSIDKFLLGFAPFSWDQLTRHVHSLEFPPELAAQTGLIKSRESGDGYYDTLRSRLIFPIHNVRGKIIAFGGRTLNDGDPKSPKYLNTPESPIYKKGANLYGLNFAYEHIRREKDAVLVEGYMDLITAHQAGICNVVASLGTAVTKKQAKLLKRFTPQVTLVFDSDSAGRAAAEKGHGIFLEEGMRVRAVSLPPQSDPDSFIRQNGSEAFLTKIKEAQPLMEFIINGALRRYDITTVPGKVDCINNVLPFLTEIQNSIERGEYIKLLAEKTSVPESDILAELSHSSNPRRVRSSKNSSSGPTIQAPQKDRYSYAEKQLLSLILHQNGIINDYRDRINPKLFRAEENRQIIEATLKLYSEEQRINQSRLIDLLDHGKAKDSTTRMIMEKVDLDGWQRAAEGCLQLLEERAGGPGRSTFDKLNRAVLELKEAESKGEVLDPLLRKVQELRSLLQSEGNEQLVLRNRS